MTQREFISNGTKPRDCLRLMRQGTEKALADGNVAVIGITYDGEFDWGGRWDEDGSPLNLLRPRQSIEQGRISKKYGMFQAGAAFEVKTSVNQLFHVNIDIPDLLETVDGMDDVDVTLAPRQLREDYNKLCGLLEANPKLTPYICDSGRQERIAQRCQAARYQ
jgi:hypothetical protein